MSQPISLSMSHKFCVLFRFGMVCLSLTMVCLACVFGHQSVGHPWHSCHRSIQLRATPPRMPPCLGLAPLLSTPTPSSPTASSSPPRLLTSCTFLSRVTQDFLYVSRTEGLVGPMELVGGCPNFLPNRLPQSFPSIPGGGTANLCITSPASQR